MNATTRLMAQRQVPATVERIGAPFTVHFRIRCSRCGTTTVPAVLLSLALRLSSEHAEVHFADERFAERAA